MLAIIKDIAGIRFNLSWIRGVILLLLYYVPVRFIQESDFRKIL